MTRFAALFFVTLAGAAASDAGAGNVPGRVPPKRSSQIKDGFGVNSPLPRLPYLPWDRRWWTRMFDAGFQWIRIGQYENSSDQIGWDWVERRRGVYSVSPEVDDYIDSLADNGVGIQLQMCYGNPLYTTPAGRLPSFIQPAPGTAHPPERGLNSIFWAPVTPEQIEAFARYTTWTVKHFRGRIRYYALWNEQDKGYWGPNPDPEQYGRLLKAFVAAVHAGDAGAKVIYGGQAGPSREFTKRALDTCQCAGGLDVYAHHGYPGFGGNMHPETMDRGEGGGPQRSLREFVRAYPGIRKDIEFWHDEFNSIGAWKGNDDSVQAKYVPRAFLYNWGLGVRTFVWQLTSGTDGNEFDDFAIVKGLAYRKDDFAPRPVVQALQNVNALFSDTKPDPSIKITGPDKSSLRNIPLYSHGFRANNGKAIVAYWLAAHSEPGDRFEDIVGNLTVAGAGIERPVIIDIRSGKITPTAWKPGTRDELAAAPFRDSVVAIADESYFDWPVLPETPSSLVAKADDGAVRLTWQVHGEGIRNVIVERRAGPAGKWERLASLPAASTTHADSAVPRARPVSYRVRAANAAGQSAYSNVVRVK